MKQSSVTNIVSERLFEARHVGKCIVQQRDVCDDGFLIRFNDVNICAHNINDLQITSAHSSSKGVFISLT